MKAAAVVPFRPDGCTWRLRAFDYVRRRLEQTGLPVYTGDCDGLWRKGLAVRAAVAQTDADVLVVSDADVWCEAITDSLADIAAGAQWSVPHWRVRRMSQSATVQAFAGAPLDGPLVETSYVGIIGGGIVVLTRELFDEVPIDPRFVGWGQEDEAWGLALAHRRGRPERHRGVLWHLWHPPQERMSRGIGSTESLDLFRQYTRNVDAALIEARRALKGATL